MKPFRTTLLKCLHIHPRRGRLAWLGNFEVERDWKQKQRIGLPVISSQSKSHLCLAELALLLSEPQDLVLLKDEPDADFLDYLSALGWRMPQVVTTDRNTESLESLTRMFLTAETEGAPEAVARWSQAGSCYLMPHGTSACEERLSTKWGIPLATPPSRITQSVNSKLFSRKLCEKHRIPQVKGHPVETLDELERAFKDLSPLLKHSPLVLKEGMGVSGKGMLRIENEAKYQQVVRMLRQTADKRGTDQTEFVLEEWIDKSQDLNIHFIIGKDGEVERVDVLTALVNKGSHLGHVHPHLLSPANAEALKAYASVLGRALNAEGYYGAAGLDAMVGADGALYPCVEINARLNMSTYHTRVLHEWVGEDRHVLIRSFSFYKIGQLPFSSIQSALQERLYTATSRKGALICAFAPVNTQDNNLGNRGKLYTMLVGDTPQECLLLQQFCLQQLQQIEGVGISVDP
jgi:biotin carboxylase